MSPTDLAPARRIRRRAIVGALGLALALGLVLARVGAELWSSEGRAYREGLDEARRLLEVGLPLDAHRRLVELSGRIRRDDEVFLALGDAEQALGRPEAAAEQWSKIGPRSPWRVEASTRIGRGLMLLGRFTPAEDRLVPAAVARGQGPNPARDALIDLYRLEGRIAEVRNLIEGGWTPAHSPLATLRALDDLDLAPAPGDDLRATLAEAARVAPDDDRVWLALANLDVRTGRLAAASERLRACLDRRPEDPAAWRSRLGLAIATDSPDDAVKALPHLEASSFSRADLLELRGWLAARAGDPALDRRALEDLAGNHLRTVGPLDRLIEQADKRGDQAAADAWKARKADFERDLARYRSLLRSEDANAHAVELAVVARRVGRHFDARCWWALNSKAKGGLIRSRSAEASLIAEDALGIGFGTVAETLADVVEAIERKRSEAATPAPESPNRPGSIE